MKIDRARFFGIIPFLRFRVVGFLIHYFVTHFWTHTNTHTHARTHAHTLFCAACDNSNLTSTHVCMCVRVCVCLYFYRFIGIEDPDKYVFYENEPLLGSKHLSGPITLHFGHLSGSNVTLSLHFGHLSGSNVTF